VNWLGVAPHRRIAEGDTSARRPVVAVFDSSVGEHPWLGPEHVVRDPEVLGTVIGLPPDPAPVEASGTTEGLVGELGEDAGHGTFIAGLIRQGCPDALVLAVRLFQSDGVVDESELLRSLQLLTLRHLLGVNGADGYAPVDVVSLSLGYYHEQPEDAAFDALLHGPLALLGRYGVCVVVSAGNDATIRPAYPAAFAPYDGGSVPDDEKCIPVSAVGALNPDRSIAMFSNDGPWVHYLRPGAALVSTFPITYNASQSASNQVLTSGGEVRRSLDPDNYSAGFAVWSGTSFSAPVFAGEVAEHLQREFEAGDASTDPTAAVARGRRVLDGLPKRGAS
jgi:subtilisin family serine protease